MRTGLVLGVVLFLMVACREDDGAGPAREDNALACADGADNDGDSLVDCDDEDCRAVSVCVDGDAGSDAVAAADAAADGADAACVAACEGLACGDDGCGGSCGPCAAGETCLGGRCACVPDCSGRSCGDDGCGGSCGDCAAGASCTPEGACFCAPACADRECGPDGCGGTCGTCEEAGMACGAEGLCVATADCPDGTCAPAWGATCAADAAGYRLCVPDEGAPIGCFTETEPIACRPERTCAADGPLPCAGPAMTVELFLVIDRSASLAGAPWEALAGGVRRFADAYGPVHSLGGRVFPWSVAPCEPGPRTPLGPNNQIPIRTLVGGTTDASPTRPLAAALADLAADFGDPAEGEAVVVLTAGGDTCAEDPDTAFAAVRALRARGVATFAVGVGPAVDDAVLDRLARDGGTAQGGPAASYRAQSDAAVFAALDDVVRRLDGRRCGETGCDVTGVFTRCADGRITERRLCGDVCDPVMGCLDCTPDTFACTGAGATVRCSAAGGWEPVTAVAEVEPNDTFATANGPLCGALDVTGAQGAAADVDRFELEIAAQGTVRATIRPPSGAPPAAWSTALTLSRQAGGSPQPVAESVEGTVSAVVDPGTVWIGVFLPGAVFPTEYVLEIEVP